MVSDIFQTVLRGSKFQFLLQSLEHLLSVFTDVYFSQCYIFTNLNYVMSPAKLFEEYHKYSKERRTKMNESTTKTGRRKSAPVRSTEARENQIANLALDLAEKQIRDGTASAAVITHFLKLITQREKLENDRLKSDLRVADAKIKQIQDQADIKTLYEKALSAMRRYSGNQSDEEEDRDEDFY